MAHAPPAQATLAIMKTTSVIWLSVATAACVALSVAITLNPRASTTIQSPSQLLPELGGQVQAITGLQLTDGAHIPLVTLSKTDQGWWVEPMHFFADQKRVLDLLTSLSALTVIAKKTTDPTRFNELGVADPTPTNQTSIYLELQGTHPPIRLIIGHPAGAQGSYVRPAGAQHASEVRPTLRLGRSPLDWVEHRLIDLPEHTIKIIHIQRHDDWPWQMIRPTADAPHVNVIPQLRSSEVPFAGAADALLKTYEQLSLTDLRLASTQSNGIDHSMVTTFDGFTLTITSVSREPPCWVSLHASIDRSMTANDNEQAQALITERVKAFNLRHHEWEYQLAPERCSAIFQKRNDLLKALP
jgi:hypothetical protein